MPSRLFEHHLCPSLDLSNEDKSVSSHFSPSLAALRAHGTEASTQWPGLETGLPPGERRGPEGLR